IPADARRGDGSACDFRKSYFEKLSTFRFVLGRKAELILRVHLESRPVIPDFQRAVVERGEAIPSCLRNIRSPARKLRRLESLNIENMVIRAPKRIGQTE